MRNYLKISNNTLISSHVVHELNTEAIISVLHNFSTHIVIKPQKVEHLKN